MTAKYDHLRAKAIELRTQYQMTLPEIMERLQPSKTPIYYWIKDYPIKRAGSFARFTGYVRHE